MTGYPAGPLPNKTANLQRGRRGDNTNMSDQFKTPGDTIREITNVPVNTARANVDRVFRLCEKELANLPIEQSNAVFSMLQATQQMRIQVMQGVVQDHQAETNYKRQKEAEAAQAKLEAEQAEIEKANRPKLAPAGASSLQ